MVKRLALLALAGCNYITGSFVTNDFSGDPFPDPVELSSGAVIVGLQPDSSGIRTAVLDISSPFTVIDRGVDAEPQITYPVLTMMGLDPATGLLDKPRARFDEPQVLSEHPCVTDQCFVGTPSNPRPFDAILGLNAFTSDALRLDLGADEVFVLPDIAGDNSNRGLVCDAVLPQPFRGGGTLLIGGTEVEFSNFRVTFDTCLAPNPSAPIQEQRGANVLMVASTSIGVTILGETPYARYRQVVPTAPDVSTLPDSTVLLPSGPITGKLVTIPSLALVGNSTSSPRAPCRQVYSSFLMADHDCVEGEDCPCTGDSFPRFCATPAVVMLTPSTPIDVLVVSDDNETLQSLRAELRPDRPEVDGILGTNALPALELDLDYPHNRALGRCFDDAACSARPELSSASRRDRVRDCIVAQPGPILRVNP
jgi:hypothetical protein